MPDTDPTPDDMLRDLLADLAYCGQFDRHQHQRCNSPTWVKGWRAALRRAIAAEAVLRRLVRGEDMQGVAEDARRHFGEGGAS